jgi:multimeric flavodoxin WrbA
MGKKIIVLNGSPRANGNTAALIEAFTKGAEHAGNTVVCFDLQKMNIHGCLGCIKGGGDPDSPCVQKDDMDQIYPVYKEADVVVLASPLYYWNLSGQLRTAFDRLFAVAECNEGYANPQKDSVLLMAAEGYEFEEVVYYYKSLIKHIQWNDLGQVLVGGVLQPGDIKGNSGLEEARKLGALIQ